MIYCGLGRDQLRPRRARRWSGRTVLAARHEDGVAGRRRPFPARSGAVTLIGVGVLPARDAAAPGRVVDRARRRDARDLVDAAGGGDADLGPRSSRASTRCSRSTCSPSATWSSRSTGCGWSGSPRHSRRALGRVPVHAGRARDPRRVRRTPRAAASARLVAGPSSRPVDWAVGAALAALAGILIAPLLGLGLRRDAAARRAGARGRADRRVHVVLADARRRDR